MNINLRNLAPLTDYAISKIRQINQTINNQTLRNPATTVVQIIDQLIEILTVIRSAVIAFHNPEVTGAESLEDVQLQAFSPRTLQRRADLALTDSSDDDDDDEGERIMAGLLRIMAD